MKRVHVKIKSLKTILTKKYERRLAVDSAVMTVENRMHDAILTAMDNVVISRVNLALRSITESSR